MAAGQNLIRFRRGVGGFIVGLSGVGGGAPTSDVAVFDLTEVGSRPVTKLRRLSLSASPFGAPTALNPNNQTSNPAAGGTASVSLGTARNMTITSLNATMTVTTALAAGVILNVNITVGGATILTYELALPNGAAVGTEVQLNLVGINIPNPTGAIVGVAFSGGNASVQESLAVSANTAVYGIGGPTYLYRAAVIIGDVSQALQNGVAFPTLATWGVNSGATQPAAIFLQPAWIANITAVKDVLFDQFLQVNFQQGLGSYDFSWSSDAALKVAASGDPLQLVVIGPIPPFEIGIMDTILTVSTTCEVQDDSGYGTVMPTNRRVA